jgi:hypothetical protein
LFFFSSFLLLLYALLLFSQKGLSYGREKDFCALFRVKLDGKC